MIADALDRTLTEHEHATLPHVLGLLHLWRIYLSRVAPRSTLASAGLGYTPIKCVTPTAERTDPRVGLRLAPVLVNPEWAGIWLWGALTASDDTVAARDRDLLPRDLSAALTAHTLASGLEWMGRDYGSVRPATTQRPVGERSSRALYRRQGWWQISGHVWWRLNAGVFVPSMRPLRGRPVTSTDPLTVTPRPGLVAPTPVPSRLGEAARHLLRAYLESTETTPSIVSAQVQQRPVISRSRGRTPVGLTDGTATDLPLERESVLVSAGSLATFVRSGGLGATAPGPWWSETESGLRSVARLLDRLIAGDRGLATEPGLSRVPRFSTLDSPGSPRQPGGPWFRVDRGWVGAGVLDDREMERLTAEWNHLVGHERARVAAARAARAAEEEQLMRELRFGSDVEETIA